MKRHCTIALTFDVETKDWGGRDWRGRFARQCRDVVRAVNAMPKLDGKIMSAYLTYDDMALPTHINPTERGAPIAGASQVFQYCAECPNRSYCATQGFCARVRAAKPTRKPSPRKTRAKE